MEKLEIKLERPFETQGRTIDKITVRACSFADLEMTGIKKAEELDEIKNFKKLASHLTSLSPDDLGRVDMRDWGKIGGAVNYFLGLAPAP